MTRQAAACTRRWSLFLAVAALACVAPAGAQFPMEQVPDKFENLQILPKDIQKEQLVKVMLAFTKGLGVRCHYCHVGEEGQPLSTFEFASDDKAHKKVARLMMQMVTDINENYLPKLAQFEQEHEHQGEGHEKQAEAHEAPRVECITCHRGQAEPKVVEETPLEVVPDKKGAQQGGGDSGGR